VFVQTLHPAEGRWGPLVPTFRLIASVLPPTASFPGYSSRIRIRDSGAGTVTAPATRATPAAPPPLQRHSPPRERAARRAGGHGEKDTEERLGLKNLVGTGGSESPATSTFASPIR
jgi:hypothetical protein